MLFKNIFVICSVVLSVACSSGGGGAGGVTTPVEPQQVTTVDSLKSAMNQLEVGNWFVYDMYPRTITQERLLNIDVLASINNPFLGKECLYLDGYITDLDFNLVEEGIDTLMDGGNICGIFDGTDLFYTYTISDNGTTFYMQNTSMTKFMEVFATVNEEKVVDFTFVDEYGESHLFENMLYNKSTLTMLNNTVISESVIDPKVGGAIFIRDNKGNKLFINNWFNPE